MLKYLTLLFFAAVLALSPCARADDAASVTFGPGTGRAWLSGCELESDRYVVCKNAEPDVLDAVAHPGTGTPGEALQEFMRKLFEVKGCSFELPAASFRVNGIFLSFDSEQASRIRCQGQRSALVFAPGRMSLLDTVYFLDEDPAP